ncbi:MAG TPA: MFS transporter [Bryobacteraceae bacterium]|jgi:ACS family hexuronate transporter-like MFS transporter|nr:MFS transporter [Bryobacteraceae bacterium]
MRTSPPILKTTGPAAASSAIGTYRWRICALLFFVTTLNYMDRQVLGVLAPDLQRVIGWNEIQYGNIVTVFQGAYAVGLLLAGRFIDGVGTRTGYAIAIALWSFATIGHSLARTVLAFAAARFLLGLSEAANFPAAIKTVAEWFPRKERALATGIFNSGANIGAVVAPAAAPWIALHWGWQWAFVCMGALSAFWVLPWMAIYRRPEAHPKLTTSELRYIQSDPAEPAAAVPWRKLLPHRQTWAFIIGRFLTDPIWWFFLFWLPKFFHSQYGLELGDLGWPLVVVYTMSMAGSIGGGWLSAQFLKRGWSLNAARKTAMLVCAVAVVPIIVGATAGKLWIAVALVGLATAAHQGWSANLYTMASDTFPKRAVASVVGIAGFGGAVGGMLIATFTGFVLQITGSYLPMFVIAGSAYLVALAIIQLLVPRLEPAQL